VKQVYTDKELNKLLVKPDITYFEDFRNYTIINLLLATGARTNTILNIKIKDVDLEEGYIIFNTTKAHKVVRIGLERKCKNALEEYIGYWRNVNDGDIEPDDYLFCNNYEEQLTRSGLTTAIARYNRRRGVEKTSLHLFRHTFAKNWITSGGDLITLAQVLTHSELDMVKKYANLYAHDVKGEIEEHSTLSQLRTKSGQTMTTKRREQE
jgi:integrase/recombinase XerD